MPKSVFVLPFPSEITETRNCNYSHLFCRPAIGQMSLCWTAWKMGDSYNSFSRTAHGSVFRVESCKHFWALSDILDVWGASCSTELGYNSDLLQKGFFVVFCFFKELFSRVSFHPLCRCLKIIWCRKLHQQLPACLWSGEAATNV